jgi:hypothetical protein
MTNTKKTKPGMGAVLLLSAVIAVPVLITGPSFGKDARTSSHHRRIHRHVEYQGYREPQGYRDYSGYLDPNSGHYDKEFQRNREDFGTSGRDPSRVGGEDPNLHPSPY